MSVPAEMVRLVSSTIGIPLVVGGGIVTLEQAVDIVKAGAKIIVQGNIVEKTALSDGGKLIKATIAKSKEVASRKKV
jgi:heptaprenylglyceryl phosphate synthase